MYDERVLNAIFDLLMDEKVPDTWDKSDYKVVLEALTGTLEDIIDGSK